MTLDVRERMTLRAALDDFYLALEGAKSPATLVWYRRRLERLADFLGEVDIQAVTITDLRRFRADLIRGSERYTTHPSRRPMRGGLSQWTLHGYIRATRRLFRWLVDEGVLDISPAVRLELPPLPNESERGLPYGSMLLIVREAQRSSPRDYALVMFLASTACRLAGVCGLTLSDLELERGRAVVREKGGGNRKERVVHLVPEACEALRAWLAVRPAVAWPQVFIGRYGGPLSAAGVYRLLQRLAQRSGVSERWNPHNWRHGAARAFLLNGGSLAELQQILGHTDPGVTARFYARFLDEQLHQSHSDHNWLKVGSGDSAQGDS